MPKAIHAAERRAEQADVDITFREGDVSALRESGVGSGYSFFLDVECFNHLNGAQRTAMGREINAVATTDATMLLLVWSPARRGPLPPGAGPDDLARAFPGWQIVDTEPYAGNLPLPLRRTAPRWYRLRRA